MTLYNQDSSEEILSQFNRLVTEIESSELDRRRSLGIVKLQFWQYDDFPLDKEIFGVVTLNHFMSLCYPSYCNVKPQLSGKKPIRWVGDKIPEKDVFYVVRLRSQFDLKDGKEAFIFSKSGILYPSNIPLKSSKVNYDGQSYEATIDKYGVVQYCSPDIYLTKYDFEMFKENYNIYQLEIIGGVYFM